MRGDEEVKRRQSAEERGERMVGLQTSRREEAEIGRKS